METDHWNACVESILGMLGMYEYNACTGLELITAFSWTRTSRRHTGTTSQNGADEHEAGFPKVFEMHTLFR